MRRCYLHTGIYSLCALGLVSCGLILKIPDADDPALDHLHYQGENADLANLGGTTHPSQPTTLAPPVETGQGGQTPVEDEFEPDEVEVGEVFVPDESCDGDCPCVDECDCDGDGVLSIECGGHDCDDQDPNVFPGQTKYFAVRSPNVSIGFDYNCSTVIELPPSYKPVNCAALSLGNCSKQQGFIGPVPPCGESGLWGKCVPALLTCNTSVIDTEKTVVCQ